MHMRQVTPKQVFKNFFMSTSFTLSSPAPHFLDDRAVVEIGFAGAHAGLQHVGMHFKHRQFLPDGGGLVEHQMHIFQRLLDAAFRRKIAAHHFRPFGLHHLRIGGRAARHLKKSRGVETKPLGKDQALRQSEAIEAEDQIDRELGAAAIADFADVEAADEQRVEHVCHIVGDRNVAADQRNTVAAAHLIAGAGHRHIEIADAARD